MGDRKQKTALESEKSMIFTVVEKRRRQNRYIGKMNNLKSFACDK